MTDNNTPQQPEQQPNAENSPQRPKRRKRTYVIAGIAIAALIGVGAAVDDDDADTDAEADQASTSASSDTTSNDTDTSSSDKDDKDTSKTKDAKETKDTTTKKASSSDKIEARIMCESAVEDRLKSPDSAEFPSLFSHSIDDLVSFDAEDNVYTVTEYVDAENSYGASLRTDYTCTIKPAGGDDWTVQSISGLDS